MYQVIIAKYCAVEIGKNLIKKARPLLINEIFNNRFSAKTINIVQILMKKALPTNAILNNFQVAF